MIIEIKTPDPGESITEVEIARWLKEDGDYVEKDEEICEIDSDKATFALSAEDSGVLKILVLEGKTVAVGEVVCTIDTSAKGESKSSMIKKEEKKEGTRKGEVLGKKEVVIVKRECAVAAKAATNRDIKASPVAWEMMNRNGIDAAKVNGTGIGGKITKADVAAYIASGYGASTIISWGSNREVVRKKMSTLRRKLSQRLVAVKNQTAMLTTFNEVDMSAIIEIRRKHKEEFEKKHGVGLGFMSFFTKAVTKALEHFPAINAMIDGDEIVYHNFADIGIAVSSPKGLIVPVLRNAESMSFPQIETAIKDLAAKVRERRITIEEMTGGTFSITNGGVFGSMLSTPILNPPQSAILGMHNIVERPVAINGKVEICPVMYIALSYDHRIIDGSESVMFLVEVKEMLEDPGGMLFGGNEAVKELLGLN
ncbi:MAG: 2-oxoglutarate dehydrogenase complex dihydrolipoyllysine-residue succinyltransferase [Bacteroidota bacterium]